MMFLSKSIGSNIRKLRMQKNLSQNDLAAALSVTRQTVSNYETGRSNPDLDMLERIAAALDTDLLCLLYGTPHSPEKKASKKQTLIFVCAFSVLLLFTGILYSYTYSLRFPHYIFTPYILVRLLLIPLSMIFLGAVILQIIDCFAGIRAPADPLRKIGKIITITFLIFHLIVVLPYILWHFSGLFHELALAAGEIHKISRTFPYIPIYTDIAHFFLNLMYNHPFVYIPAGTALWIFLRKQHRDG